MLCIRSPGVFVPAGFLPALQNGIPAAFSTKQKRRLTIAAL
jgi:hypothetical protein